MLNRLKRRPVLFSFFLIQLILFSTYTFVFYRPNNSSDSTEENRNSLTLSPADLPANSLEHSNRSLQSDIYRTTRVSPFTDRNESFALLNTIKSLNVSIVTEQNDDRTIVQCPLLPKHLVGRVEADLYSYDLKEIEKNYADKNISLGGHWSPPDCTSRYRVAIIIPYRNREMQLRIFLNFMHAFLQKQELDYQIYLVEPSNDVTFNRALLFNIGFHLAIKDYSWQCFIFHDVDLIPEDDRNIYSCPPEPRHMSVAVNTMNYELPYRTIFGGVSAMTKEQFESVNGFSNQYFGWGGEDDDMAARVLTKYRISRYPANIARYKMLRHKPDTPNQSRYKTLHVSAAIRPVDGLSNLQYTIKEIQREKLFTIIRVSYNETAIRSSVANLTKITVKRSHRPGK